VTTLLARRTQYHQSVLVAHTTPLDERYRQLLTNLCGYFSAHGFTPADARCTRRRRRFALLQRQAAFQGFLELLHGAGVGGVDGRTAGVFDQEV